MPTLRKLGSRYRNQRSRLQQSLLKQYPEFLFQKEQDKTRYITLLSLTGFLLASTYGFYLFQDLVLLPIIGLRDATLSLGILLSLCVLSLLWGEPQLLLKIQTNAQ
jgi:hypothetical protein